MGCAACRGDSPTCRLSAAPQPADQSRHGRFVSDQHRQVHQSGWSGAVLRQEALLWAAPESSTSSSCQACVTMPAMSWVSVLWTCAGDPSAAETLLLEAGDDPPRALTRGRELRTDLPPVRKRPARAAVPTRRSRPRRHTHHQHLAYGGGDGRCDVVERARRRGRRAARRFPRPRGGRRPAPPGRDRGDDGRGRHHLGPQGGPAQGAGATACPSTPGPSASVRRDAAPAVLSWPGEEQVWLRDLELGPDLRAAVAGLGTQPDELSVRQAEPEALPGEAMRRTARPARDRS